MADAADDALELDLPLGTEIEVCFADGFSWGNWAPGRITARDPFGVTVTLATGGSCHSRNERFRWRFPLPPPPPPTCEVCNCLCYELRDVCFPGSVVAGEASVTVSMCSGCAGASYPAGFVSRRPGRA